MVVVVVVAGARAARSMGARGHAIGGEEVVVAMVVGVAVAERGKEVGKDLGSRWRRRPAAAACRY